MNISLPQSVLAANAEARRHCRYILLTKGILACCLLTAPIWLGALFYSSPGDIPYETSLLFVPLVALGCMWMFTFAWRGDPPLRLLFGTSILARLAATSVYIWMGVVIYGESVDAFHYSSVAVDLAKQFTVIGWAAFKPPYWSTNLINNLCGVICLITGDALPTLMVIFTLAALWGGYFFYRAFCIAFPNGDYRLYAMLIIFFPSILFWSSAIGKDALEQLFIGLTSYGFARWIKKPGLRSGLICAAGGGGAFLVRPHIGAILFIACMVPYTFAGRSRSWVRTAAKVVLMPVLIASTIYIIAFAGSFVGVEGDDAQSGINAANRLTHSSQIGGSAFNEGQSLPVRMALSPFLIFRPLPFEVHNAMAGIASLEGLGFLVFCWIKRRRLKAALRCWRSPYVSFILIYATEFSLAFAAATSNFGILVRQRIMLLPLVFMLFCVNLSKSAPAGVEAAAQRDLLRRRPPALRRRYAASMVKRTES